MTIYITSGGRPSNGRLELQKCGGFKKLKPISKIKKGDTLINWGASQFESFATGGLLFGVKVLNPTSAINTAANKLHFFKAAEGLSTVPWTTEYDTAKAWLDSEHTVVVRNKLTGHSGEGIIIVEPGQELPKAPLYTLYIKKQLEYRVHVANGTVVDVQRKIRDPDREPTTWKVRSHANGFIFARNGVEISGSVSDLAVAATAACGLDFGAVDIIVDKTGTAYVLEINTAPGLEGQTIKSYIEALKKVADGHHG